MTAAALQSIAAKIAAAFSACHELASAAGSTYTLDQFAKILRSPVGLTDNQRKILADTSEGELVAALRDQFSSRRYDAALGRLPPEH